MSFTSQNLSQVIIFSRTMKHTIEPSLLKPIEHSWAAFTIYIFIDLTNTKTKISDSIALGEVYDYIQGLHSTLL